MRIETFNDETRIRKGFLDRNGEVISRRINVEDVSVKTGGMRGDILSSFPTLVGAPDRGPKSKDGVCVEACEVIRICVVCDTLVLIVQRKITHQRTFDIHA